MTNFEYSDEKLRQDIAKLEQAIAKNPTLFELITATETGLDMIGLTAVAMNNAPDVPGGAAKLWEPLAWRLHEDFIHVKNSCQAVHIILPQTSLDDLNSAQRDELAALIAVTRLEVRISKTAPVIDVTSRSPLVLEIGNPGESIRWACREADALAPSPAWGAGTQFVYARANPPLPAIPDDWLWSTPAQLRATDEAVNLVKKEKSSKIGVKTKPLKAGRNNDYLLRIWAEFKPDCPLLFSRKFERPHPIDLSDRFRILIQAVIDPRIL
ncbi:MAG: hypothetical protein ACRERU_22420 [Methylococcales bacterium]